MSYGLPKNLNTEGNEDWMEACVESVIERGRDVDQKAAINLCKRQLISKKGNITRANVGVINDLLELYSENRKKK